MKRLGNPESNESVARLLADLDVSTSNFMTVRNVSETLDRNGFLRLFAEDEWALQPGGKYYIVKNETALFAFIAGVGLPSECGMRIIAAHTDSPCFKIKPNAEIYGEGGVVSLNVEKYGGGILYTWFDRPLSASGRVLVASGDPFDPLEIILDLEDPIATVPHLAIHFNRNVNDGNPLSVQKDMKPVVGYFTPEEILEFKANGGVVKKLLAEHIAATLPECSSITPTDILDYELSLYPAESASLAGINGEYFQSARIDDLSMAYAGLEALLDSASEPKPFIRVLALFDNEETGSGTKQGAASPVLRHIAQRLCSVLDPSPQAFWRTLACSFMVSADDAHGWHPNYNEKYDPTNHPVLGGGPVVKINANCKYMTDGRGAAVFHSLCEAAGVEMQYFVNHSDVAGGSTLGNISSSQLDIPGVDVGNAIWAMHSARETAAVSDHLDMVKVLSAFLKLT